MVNCAAGDAWEQWASNFCQKWTSLCYTHLNANKTKSHHCLWSYFIIIVCFKMEFWMHVNFKYIHTKFYFKYCIWLIIQEDIITTSLTTNEDDFHIVHCCMWIYMINNLRHLLLSTWLSYCPSVYVNLHASYIETSPLVKITSSHIVHRVCEYTWLLI